MSKYPQTDLLDVPALHWHHVYSDLLGIADNADDIHHSQYVTAYVECFTREDGYYHWQVHKGDKMVEGWMDTLEEAQTDCERNFDRIRNA